MTRRFRFTLHLLDDVVISSDAATTGAHSGLDYLPGSSIRGAIAARFYSGTVPDEDAWILFHSGKVVFDDALPLVPGDGAETFPVPLSFHYPKDTPKGDEYARTLDLCRDRMPEDAQAEQWRRGYVTADGRHLKVAQRYVLKTGISVSTGMAAEGELFGHRRIVAGQRFCGAVSFEDDIDARLVTALTSALEGELWLGRSRRAEVGRVRISDLAESAAEPEGATSGSHQTIVWLLSDTALTDDFGRPTHTPSGSHFGLPDARFFPEKSFVRTQRRAWFNAALGSHEPERFVLARGSVLSFETPSPLPTRWGRAGVSRAQGLGRFVVNHPLLGGAPFEFAPAAAHAPHLQAAADEVPPSLSPSDATLLAWLRQSQTGGLSAAPASILVFVGPLKGHYRDAATLQGTAHPLGPKPTQWGAVYETARSSPSEEALRTALFGRNGTGGICADRRHEIAAWTATFPEGARMRTFRDWLMEGFDAIAADRTLDTRVTMQFLAREARQIAQQVLRLEERM